MSKYNFLYRDTIATTQDIYSYNKGDTIIEPRGLICSFLRGGLISGCNLRFLITLEIGNTLTWADTDFRNRGSYVFDLEYGFQILDWYKVGDFYQILLTPDFLDEDLKREVTKAARADFNILFNTSPVQLLDTPEWRNKVKALLGDKHKKHTHKSVIGR